MYILYRGGLLGGDIQKLLSHGNLPPLDAEIIYNLELLGARIQKPLKDNTPTPQPLFPFMPPTGPPADEVSLSRFEPALRSLLEEYSRNALDPIMFPSLKPHLDASNGMDSASSSSLRSANKPTWARTRPNAHEPRQRIIVFIAGGATYAEARACYEVGYSMSKEIYLSTSHMLTPKLFLRQVGDLSTDKRRLDLPAERPPPKAPAHLFEREPQPQSGPKQSAMPPVQASSQQQLGSQRPPVPPAVAMAAMNLNPGAANAPRPANGSFVPPSEFNSERSGKLKKDKEKKKKHLGLFK